MEINAIKKNKKAAEEGVWIPFGKDAAVKIAQWMNKKHAEYLRDVSKDHGKKIAVGAMEESESKQLSAKQWPFIIRGLKGFKENDVPVEYSADLIIEWAGREELEDFFSDVKKISVDDLVFREENIKALGEQFPTILNGTEGGREAKKA